MTYKLSQVVSFGPLPPATLIVSWIRFRKFMHLLPGLGTHAVVRTTNFSVETEKLYDHLFLFLNEGSCFPLQKRLIC